MRMIVALGIGLFTVAAVAEQDVRSKVEMPAPMVAHMLANMRDHVASLNEIHLALAARDFDRAGQVAEQRLGVSSLAAHGAEHMAPYMPKPMQAIGTEMHRAATRFALAAQERDLDKALVELAAITGRCVACHSSYRTR
jgi:hypothetical protein